MEFFDWLQAPWLVIEYMNLGNVSSAAEAAALTLKILYISLGVAAGLYLLGHLLGGIGLMKIAKRQNLSYWWFGFIPFANTYLIGALAGEVSIFGKKCKRIGLYAMLAELFYVLLEVVLLILTFMLTNADFYALQSIGGEYYFDFSAELFKTIYANFGWVLSLQLALEIIDAIWWFVTFFLMCSLFYAFFRKYYARSPFLMTFLCAFLPFKGYVLFAVRNNNPVDYTSYRQRQYEEILRQQQRQYGGNAPFTPYGSGGDPFSEFGQGDSNANGNGSGGSNDSPFNDF